MYTLQQMGTLIRERRLELGMTQTEVEERSGGRVSQATLAKFESHTIGKEPSLRIMAGIAEALQLDLNQLTGWTTNPTLNALLKLKTDSLTIARRVDKLSAEHRREVAAFVQRLTKLEEGQETYNLQLLHEIISTLEKKQNHELLRQVLKIVDPLAATAGEGTLPLDTNHSAMSMERVH